MIVIWFSHYSHMLILTWKLENHVIIIYIEHHMIIIWCKPYDSHVWHICLCIWNNFKACGAHLFNQYVIEVISYRQKRYNNHSICTLKPKVVGDFALILLKFLFSLWHIQLYWHFHIFVFWWNILFNVNNFISCCLCFVL